MMTSGTTFMSQDASRVRLAVVLSNFTPYRLQIQRHTLAAYGVSYERQPDIFLEPSQSITTFVGRYDQTLYVCFTRGLESFLHAQNIRHVVSTGYHFTRWGIGIEALPQIRKAVTESKSEEVRQQARDIAEKQKTASLTPDQRRLQAVLCVLELIASGEARRVLEDVAGGKAGPWLTGEAAEALKRMK
jgi:hypothetical protein